MKTPIALSIGILTIILTLVASFKFVHGTQKPEEQPVVQETVAQETVAPQVPEIQVPEIQVPEEKIEIKPEPIKRLPQSYKEAIAYAKSRNSKILIIFMSRNCEYCEKMRTTFSDENVKLVLGEVGVCVLYYIDTGGSESNQAKRYNIKSVPAYCIIDFDEKIHASGIGYKDVTTFISWIKGEI